jgi:hypothetical protein
MCAWANILLAAIAVSTLVLAWGYWYSLNALGPHVCALLSKGISVVLDFPGNTRAQRAWFRELFERA